LVLDGECVGPPLLQASGWVETGDNVMVVAYPNDVILVVASDRTTGAFVERARGEHARARASRLGPILRVAASDNGESHAGIEVTAENTARRWRPPVAVLARKAPPI
jgi:hypothetical protein